MQHNGRNWSNNNIYTSPTRSYTWQAWKSTPEASPAELENDIAKVQKEVLEHFESVQHSQRQQQAFQQCRRDYIFIRRFVESRVFKQLAGKE